MNPVPAEPPGARWRPLAVFAAVAFPVNLFLGAVILRFSLVERLAGPDLSNAAWDVLDFLLQLPVQLLQGNRPGEAVTIVVVALVFLASQLVFLVPWAAWKPEIDTGPGWSLRLSAASAGLVGAVLSVGLAYGLGEALVQVLITGLPRDAWGNQAVDVLERAPIARTGIPWEWLLVVPPLGLVPLWILWGILLARLTPEADPLRAELQLRKLFAGSVASIVLMIPFDALARKRGACICTTGTWISLCLGFAALLWLAGPAAFLLLSRRRRLAWRREACLACGYPKRGQSGEVCTECGVASRAT